MTTASIAAPSKDLQLGELIHRHARTVVTQALALGGSSVRLAAAVTAGTYLLVHTVRESAAFRRLLGRAPSSAAPLPAIDPKPDSSLDLVDLASWESFPASDPPGYR